MIYPYMTIGEDETEITYSKPYMFRGVRCIDVCVETATDSDLINIVVQMPFVNIKSVYGMDNNTVNRWVSFIKKNYTLINEMSLRNEVVNSATSI